MSCPGVGRGDARAPWAEEGPSLEAGSGHMTSQASSGQRFSNKWQPGRAGGSPGEETNFKTRKPRATASRASEVTEPRALQPRNLPTHPRHPAGVSRGSCPKKRPSCWFQVRAWPLSPQDGPRHGLSPPPSFLPAPSNRPPLPQTHLPPNPQAHGGPQVLPGMQCWPGSP